MEWHVSKLIFGAWCVGGPLAKTKLVLATIQVIQLETLAFLQGAFTGTQFTLLHSICLAFPHMNFYYLNEWAIFVCNFSWSNCCCSSVVPKLFWFADHSQKFGGPRRTKIDLYGDSQTTSTNLADHQWSAEQTLGITVAANNCFCEAFKYYVTL